MGGWDSADVVSIVLASTGIGLTVIGLGAVLWQVYQARGAAEAAREAATEAREAMTQRVTAMELGSIRANLRALLEQLRVGQYESARRLCQESREQLVALRTRLAWMIGKGASRKRSRLWPRPRASLRATNRRTPSPTWKASAPSST